MIPVQSNFSNMTPRFRLRTCFFGLPLVLAIAFNASAAEQPRPAAHEELAVEGSALLRDWTPPIYPAAALKSRRSGMVNVRLIVDANGGVTAARALEDESDADFVAPALAAVKTWRFAPAIENGKSVACCLDTAVLFSPAVGQEKKSSIPPESQIFRPAPRTPAKPKSAPAGDYPSVLLDRKLAGAVRFHCVVNAEGKLLATRIIAASHSDFVLTALDALQRWEFIPGMQGDLPVTSEVDGVVSFDSIVGKPEEVFEANSITAPDGTPATVTPEPRVVSDPVWPLDLLLKGEGGSASVEFTVSENGLVHNVHVHEATQPEFGRALVAALESWAFSRPMESGRGVSVPLMKRAEFTAIPLDAAADSDPLARLVLALRHGEIGGAKGLDEKLTSLYRVSPNYPAALMADGAPAGRAEIEFIIDRTGRARLPRIVSASRDEFGWSAATAVAQWVFKPPHRGGAPVDVRVKIPFEFAAPPS